MIALPRRGRYAGLALLCLLLTATSAGAAELVSVVVNHEQGRYDVVSELLVNAPQDKVFAALVDYDRFHTLSDAYVDSRYLAPAADGTPQVFTRIEGCVLFFCHGVERTARLEAHPEEWVVATVDLKRTEQLRYGVESWHLDAHRKGTRITYRHQVELAFWMPPVIGPWAVRRMLTGAALAAAQIIEEMALTGNYTPLAQSPCCTETAGHSAQRSP